MVSPEAEELRWNLIADARATVIGVYEALWEANTLWPDRPASDRLRIAEEAISSALAEDLLVIEVGSWADGTKAVDAREAQRLLKDWATWAIPDGPTVFVGITEKGIAYSTMQ